MLTQLKRLVYFPRFWIRLIIFTLLTGFFLGLAGLFINFNQQYTTEQHNNYKSIDVSVTDYLVIDVECGCYCYYRNNRSPSCPCNPSPYTGVIVLSYTVSNNTYFDEKRVICGSTYAYVINKLEVKFPMNEKLHMYYNIKDPDGGVVFYVDYTGSYWAGALLFFICALVTISILVGTFCMSVE